MDTVILVDADQHLIPRKEVRSRGYTSQPLPVDHDVATALSKVAQKAWQLPTDVYYSTGKRYRTFNKYSAEVLDGQIKIRAKESAEPYFQDAGYNPELGGVERSYEPIDREVANDVGLCKIMAYLIARLPGSRPGQTYDVNLHIMRYCATRNLPCETSPPGFHKDGEKYISVVLVGCCGLRGGHVQIADNDMNCLENLNMRQSGECYIIDDDLVYHKLTPVEVGENCEYAYRDILLFDFMPQNPIDPQ